MKNIFLTTLFVIATSTLWNTSVFSQISEGGTPPSFSELKSFEEIDLVTIASPDLKDIQLLDDENEKNGTFYKISKLLDVDLNMANSGTWSTLQDGTEIWRLIIESTDAKGLALHFDYFNIPVGAKFFVYNSDHSVVLGAFTSFNNTGNNATTIGILPGDEMILEYVSPRAYSKSIGTSSVSEPDFQIASISYLFRGMEYFDPHPKSTGFGASDDCQVNINCSEGTNWQTQKKGVARIYVVEDGYGGYCSGTLVNNTANNGTPYFLTADHCGGTATTSEFNQWVFYFNFEASGCTNPSSSPSYNSISGCTKKARSPLNGGSDFLLLQLNSTPPSNYSVIYNGWNRANTASSSGVSIHHPAGDIKKISTYTSALTTSTYNGGAGNTGATNAHWRVIWAETTNGWGVTEGGSSGSPIFDNNGRVVGTLSGGQSYCSATTSPDLYGKFYYHWDQYGSTNADKLKPWLDPQGTNPTTLDYYNPNSTTLNANFTASPTTVTVGGTVNFTSTSTGSPTSHSWSFPGGTPTSSSAVNPSIVYNTAGTYNVTLTVSNGSTSDTETKTAYITVNPQGSGFSLDFEACTDFQLDGFTPWTTYDGDGSATYGANDFDYTNEGYTGSFLAFNSTSTTPEATGWEAHGGVRCGICFAATTPPNNDWLISPQATMQTGGSFSFWAKSITDQYGLERFKVLVSTTNNSTSSFTAISTGTYVQASTTWTQYTYSLAAYSGQNIYVAIQCVSNDAFGFMIDDIVLNTGTAAGTAPVANFSGTPTTVVAGNTVAFTDLSTNSPTSRAWSFPGGTPTSSSATNPTITYNTPGTYNVSLTVTNTYGTDSEVKTGYITVTAAGTAPVANFSGTPTTVVAGNTVAFTDLSTNSPTSRAWSFPGGTPTSSSATNPTITYNTPGTYNVSLTVTNAYGNDSEVKNGYITVTAAGTAPVANFSGTPTTVVAGNTVAFTDLSTNSPTSRAWSFPGGTPTSSSATNPTITYNTPGTYNVSLTVTNAYGNDSEVKNGYITVTTTGTAPVANFVGTPTTVDVGNTVAFTDLSTNSPTSRSWSFPGGTPTSSSATNPTITYNTPGTYNVSLTVTNAYGNDSEVKNGYITVVQPSTNFSLDFEACSDFQVDNFSPWVTLDVDGIPTTNLTGVSFMHSNYTGSFIAFNHTSTNPDASTEYAAHGGERCGICMPLNSGSNNDWLISPQITLQNGASFAFWAKSASYLGMGTFNVLISTTTNNPASFSALPQGSNRQGPTVWGEFVYTLSAYAGQTVYVAIQVTSTNGYGLMLDDITLNSSTDISGQDVFDFMLYPNPNEGSFMIDAGDYNGDLAIEVYNINGQKINVNQSVNGKMLFVDLQDAANGFYFVRVKSENGIRTFKVSVIR